MKIKNGEDDFITALIMLVKVTKNYSLVLKIEGPYFNGQKTLLPLEFFYVPINTL